MSVHFGVGHESIFYKWWVLLGLGDGKPVACGCACASWFVRMGWGRLMGGLGCVWGGGWMRGKLHSYSSPLLSTEYHDTYMYKTLACPSARYVTWHYKTYLMTWYETCYMTLQILHNHTGIKMSYTCFPSVDLLRTTGCVTHVTRIARHYMHFIRTHVSRDVTQCHTCYNMGCTFIR